MSQQRTPVGPWLLVEQLRTYLTSTAWCAWLELGGSLGRGAGDERSDVDAVVGVQTGTSLWTASAAALRAILSFAPVAGHLTTPSCRQHVGDDPGSQEHGIQYSDGRQLSLVLRSAADHPGLPVGSIAVLDRGRRSPQEYRSSLVSADPRMVLEWSFLAWWELGDADKHLERGSVWRAIASLEDARRHAWQLHAERIDVDDPALGAVSVENAARPAPCWMAATHPTSTGPGSIRAALLALAAGLSELTDPVATGRAEATEIDGIRAVVLDRLHAGHVRIEPSGP